MSEIRKFATSSAVILTLDYIYISLIKKWFNSMIKRIQGGSFTIKMRFVILAYIIICFGFYYFVVKKELNIPDSMLLGSFIYSTYDLTNLATINNWDPTFALLDSIWGGVLFGSANFISQKF